jgi:taurine dioxygenase
MSVVAEDQGLRIAKIKPHVGAIATGVDLTRPVDPATFRRLYDALLDNVALVIRGQNFTPAEYQAAAERFGALMEDQNRRYLVPGFPMISVLSNRHKDSAGKPAKIAKNASWHTDHTNQEQPPKFTCLYALELPDRGGGTGVCNMRAAYEALPEDWRRRIDGMQTANTLISSARMTESANADIVADQQAAAAVKPPTVHPLVRTHPELGTKAIWFHQNKTEKILGMEPAATQAFLTELLDVAMKPEFSMVHDWRVGDMLLIDNRQAMHKAGLEFDQSQHRHLWRILVRGDRPY